MPSASPVAPVELDLNVIAQALGSLATHFHIEQTRQCTSTNSVLVDAPPVDDGRTHVLFASEQTAGRGRRGRSWLSWPGASLTFSALWRFPAGAPVPAGLSLVAGLALARSLEKLGVLGIQLKWPNDVLILGDKCAGILVELLPGKGRTPAAVIGIGINLQLPAAPGIDGQTGVTSLADHLPRLPSSEHVAAALLAELHGLLQIYTQTGFAPLRHAWEQRHAFQHLPVVIQGEQFQLSGVCIGIDDQGVLLVRNQEGVHPVLSGEVSLRGAS